MSRGREVLVAEGLVRTYPAGGHRQTSVKRASLSVAREEMVAILGRSGAGKSTLLALCGGLERPDNGRVVVDGQDLAALPLAH